MATAAIVVIAVIASGMALFGLWEMLVADARHADHVQHDPDRSKPQTHPPH